MTGTGSGGFDSDPSPVRYSLPTHRPRKQSLAFRQDKKRHRRFHSFNSALGISEITSPSFNYYFLYKGKIPLLHLDAYRLNDPSGYPSLMIDELLTPQMLFIIEWPERVGAYLPKNTAMMEFSIVKEGLHLVRMI